MEVFVVMKKGKIVMVDAVFDSNKEADKLAREIIESLYGVKASKEAGKYVPNGRSGDVYVEVVKKTLNERA
jgi:hypothetical protein